MNVFYEFHKIVQHFQREGVAYALIGGVAVAFHGYPRFTKDIDLLIGPTELARVTAILRREGYVKSSEPWTFKSTKLTLHRFLKVQELDEMMVDVLVAGTARHRRIIAEAQTTESRGTGAVKVASKPDLIWLKRKRRSRQDEADIARLSGEEA